MVSLTENELFLFCFVFCFFFFLQISEPKLKLGHNTELIENSQHGELVTRDDIWVFFHNSMDDRMKHI
jgi:hypothetical protein